MTTSYKKNVLLSLAISVGLFVIFPAGLIFMADHCHIFHKPIKGIFDHGFTGDLRCQNAGLINNYLENPQEHFDSVFTGTSLSGNFLPEHLADKTPWKRTLKLTFPVQGQSSNRSSLNGHWQRGTSAMFSGKYFPTNSYFFHLLK